MSRLPQPRQTSDGRGIPTKKGKPCLPEPVPRSYAPYLLDTPGWWLVASDQHVPYHDLPALTAAIKEGKKARVVGVLLNGDVLDSHELSTFDKDPTAPRYREERQAGIALLAYLRDQFPKARIVYKAGNHEERLERYLMNRAPALFGMDLLGLPQILDFATYGIEHVGDKRVVRLGKLNVLHGHEYRPAIQVPVNPARGLFLRTKGLALCGHWHQTSEHHEPTITGKAQGCWSTGCLCQLSPAYSPLNRWGHGAALVRLDPCGDFHVRNMRIIDGKIM